MKINRRISGMSLARIAFASIGVLLVCLLITGCIAAMNNPDVGIAADDSMWK